VAVLTWACGDGGTGPGVATSLSVTPTQATLGLGDTLRLSVSLRDANGGELSTSGITWTSSDMSRVGVSQVGVVSALALGGPVTVTARSGSLAAQAQITVVAGSPTQLSVVTQPSTGATSGVALVRQPVLELRDAAGNASPTAGIQVTAALVQGQGTLSGATATTDQNGRATFAGLTITGATGAYRLSFQAPGLTPTVSSLVTLSAAASVSMNAQPPATAQSGATFTAQPRVLVSGFGGSPLAGEPVTVSIASGGGTLSGTTTVPTDASGVAAFTGLALSGIAGVRTLRFTAGGVFVDSDPIVLEAGTVPDSLVIVTQPSSSASNGVPFAQQPVVEVRDGAGNPIPGATVTVALASGSGTLGGTTSVATNANGRVAFADLSLTGATGQYVIEFTSGAVSIQSTAITLSVGTPASVTMVTQPSATAQSGVVFAQQPAVDVRDAGDNPVVGVAVTASIATGGGTLGGTATATTNASGRATFSGLSISGIVGTRTLLFTSGAATATSGNIQLQPGALDHLVITTQPSANATNDVAFSQQPAVQAADAAGNGISGVGVAAAIQSGGGSLGGTATATTNGAGVATFANLKITGTVGPRTLRFSNGGIGTTSNVINLSAGAAAAATFTTQPPSFTFSGVTFTSSPSVQVRDVSSNPVPGVNVLVTIDSGGGTLGGTQTVATNGSGVATFSGLSISGSVGGRTLKFASGAAQVTSGTVNVSYGEGTQLITYCGSQQMDVFVPANSFTRPRPVAVYVHGGGWTSGDRTLGLLLPEVKSELLSRGYVVVSVDYRLADSTAANFWPAQINDVKCAIRHLRAKAGEYGGDGRIVSWGASAGGHLTSMLGVTDASDGLEGSGGFSGVSSRVDAAVPIGGISDLTDAPTHPEIGFFGPEWTFDDWPAAQYDASPIEFATGDDPPFLIIHGDQDATVLYPQATKLNTALGGAGATTQLVTVVNGGHNLDDVGAGTPSYTLAQLATTIANFFDAQVLP
jgi:acetyl esterase/lipase/5-hydroxyisourate hydrolase-like protein (transthyretin family)